MENVKTTHYPDIEKLRQDVIAEIKIRRVSQLSVANQIGLDQTYLNRFVQGHATSPSVAQWVSIIRWLGAGYGRYIKTNRLSTAHVDTKIQHDLRQFVKFLSDAGHELQPGEDPLLKAMDLIAGNRKEEGQ